MRCALLCSVFPLFACPLLRYKHRMMPCLQACTTGCACALSDAAGAGPSSAAANAARAGGAANLNAGQSAAAARLFEKVQVLPSCCWHFRAKADTGRIATVAHALALWDADRMSWTVGILGRRGRLS